MQSMHADKEVLDFYFILLIYLLIYFVKKKKNVELITLITFLPLWVFAVTTLSDAAAIVLKCSLHLDTQMNYPTSSEGIFPSILLYKERLT